MGKLLARLFGGAAFILLASAVGFAAFFYSKAHVEPKGVTETAQIQFELDEKVGMKNEVTLIPRGELTDVRVEFGSNPPELQKPLFVHDTNMVVRRHVAKLGELEILWAGQKPGEGTVGGTTPLAQIPGAGVLGQADAGAKPAPVDKPSVTQLPDKPSVTVLQERPAARGTGQLTLVTFPEAQVTEGGKALGKTPLFAMKLPAGTHLLTLAGTDGKRHRLSVRVAAGQTTSFKLKLDDLP